MGTFAVIGEEVTVACFALASATVLVAEGPEEVLHAWNGLSAATTVVVLSARAAAVLGDKRAGREGLLHVVLPQ